MTIFSCVTAGAHPHDDLLRTQTAICLDIHVEFVRFCQVVKRLVIPRRLFLLCVVAERPLCAGVAFIPV